MTPERFRVLIEGLLAVWRVEAALTFEEEGCRCAVDAGDQAEVTISFERQPFGGVWRVAEPGRRDRVHPSIGAALKSLREILCPGRSAGRVLFVSESGS